MSHVACAKMAQVFWPVLPCQPCASHGRPDPQTIQSPQLQVDLTRYHPRPCLEFHIKRCLGPCVKDLTTPDIYAMQYATLNCFLMARQRIWRNHYALAWSRQLLPNSSKPPRVFGTNSPLWLNCKSGNGSCQRGDDADVFGYHFEQGRVAVFLLHMRNARYLTVAASSGKTCRRRCEFRPRYISQRAVKAALS